MSDFGCMVIVARRDGKSVIAQDRACLNHAICSVPQALQRQDANAKPFRFTVIDSHALGGRDDLAVILTEYWQVDIDEGLNKGRSREELLEQDRPAAEKVCNAVAEELGSDYRLELYCNDW